MVIILILIAGATVGGLGALWPDKQTLGSLTSDVEFASEGVTFPQARITHIEPECFAEAGSGPDMPAIQACQIADVMIIDGERKGERTSVYLRGSQANSDLRVGDTLVLMNNPDAAEYLSEAGPEADGSSLFGINRNLTLLAWTAVFVIVVIAVGRIRGFFALLALAMSGGIVLSFILPGLLSGAPGIALALVGSSAIMYVALYLAHGFSMRTSAALLGTLISVAITALIAYLSVRTSRLSGMSDEESGLLSSIATNMDFQGLLTCAIIIAGLGILNDVTITQTSSVWELRAAGPTLSRREIFAGAMRIGRDHIASTIYTIVFAYTGAALTVLLLLYLYDQPVLNILSQDQMALEIVRTLTSGIGLVLAVPITTAIAAVLLPAQPRALVSSGA